MGLEYAKKMVWDRRGFGVRKTGKSICLLEETAFQSLG